MPRREQLEQMLKADPDDVFLQYALAMECVSAGDVEEGLARLGRVNEQHPDYVAAWFQRGQVLAREDRMEDAREVLTRGLDVARKVGDNHAAGEMSEFLDSL